MLGQFFTSLFLFTQALAASTSSYVATIPAYEAAVVQWRDITFVVPANTFEHDTTLTITDNGVFADAVFGKLPHSYVSAQHVYAFVFSEEPQIEIPMTLQLDVADTSNRRRRIFYAEREGGEWMKVRSRIYQTEQLARYDTLEQSGMVVVGTHKKNKEVPVKLKEFTDFGNLPYSDAGIVIDEKSGKVLYQQNQDKKRSIASLTKLLTTIVCLERTPDFAQTVTYSASYNPGGASMTMHDGDTLSLENALYGALVPSANNMAMTVAHACGDSYTHFIAEMNAYAHNHRATNTHVDEPTGLDPDNISTARDISRIARRAFRRYPTVYERAADMNVYNFVTKNTGRTVSENSTNLFDGKGKYEAVAFKTGYLPPYAERTLVIKVRKIGTEHTVILVLLGNPEYKTIFDEAYSLIDWTFNNWIFQNYGS